MMTDRDVAAAAAVGIMVRLWDDGHDDAAVAKWLDGAVARAKASPLPPGEALWVEYRALLVNGSSDGPAPVGLLRVESVMAVRPPAP